MYNRLNSPLPHTNVELCMYVQQDSSRHLGSLLLQQFLSFEPPDEPSDLPPVSVSHSTCHGRFSEGMRDTSCLLNKNNSCYIRSSKEDRPRLTKCASRRDAYINTHTQLAHQQRAESSCMFPSNYGDNNVHSTLYTKTLGGTHHGQYPERITHTHTHTHTRTQDKHRT